MNPAGRFVVLIPVYNHAATVAGVAEAARALGWPVWVIDDGSTDETPARLKEVAGVTVLRHETNRG